MNNYTGRSIQILLLSHISERGIRHFLSSISGICKKKKIYLATIELDGMSSVRCGPCGDPCSWEVGEADSTAPFWLHVYVGYHKFYSWCNDAVPWFMLARQHQPLSRNFICSVALFQERSWNVFPAIMMPHRDRGVAIVMSQWYRHWPRRKRHTPQSTCVQVDPWSLYVLQLYKDSNTIAQITY